MGTLGERMKRYEEVFKYNLMPRTPIIVRVDGKAFHSFTKKMDKPWDTNLVRAFDEAIEAILEVVQGCVVAYHQSDEITLVCLNDKTHETQPFFDAEVNKINTITASVTAAVMTKSLIEAGALPKGKYPAFDARCFNVPSQVEVYNNLVWRQQDAQRNAVSSWAIAALGGGGHAAKSLYGKKTEERIAIVKEKTGRDFYAEVSARFKHGQFWLRVWDKGKERFRWMRDNPAWNETAYIEGYDNNLQVAISRVFRDYYTYPEEAE